VMASELARLRPIATRRPVRQLILLIAASLVYGAGVVAKFAIRRDLHELPVTWLAGATLAWLLGFLAPIYLATVPRPGAVTPRWKLAGVAAVVASLGFIALGFALHPSGPHSALFGWARFGRGHACLEIGLATAVVPVIFGALFLRGALPVGSRWTAAALGAGGGGLGGLVLHLHCPIADGLHVGLVHGGVVGVAALLAALVVPRTTDVR